ncbi:VCBS domain-containing protein [Bradyrhizobium sp. 160]|uniref:VCBS domain-containing protein n=1 Tax=Bradyrhizobium sp. 180 TaxID=2782650 RepID=UPI001FFBEDAE|nr:VCBS domain-containing protein [Bradyrhizobium sp. 180]MCK1491917.1 VCBS domain-containing protein [Bradyrhizobium sp. 180]MCK1542407.1 VCBS domain-containing protein [Bradyrhizobium sp. 179]MCK1623162.1 VCBS domain-containing protein [Bradyrhizobium sp. 160]
MSLARVFSGLWPAPDQRSPASVRGQRARESAVVAGLGWAGGLSFLTLILSALKEAWAADPDLALFDDASITYKGFEHGTFELVTKEAVPRHIIVDDPGQTVILSRTGSSVGFAQVANNASRMEDLQNQQQDVLANYSKDHGPGGSGTPPGEAVDQSPQPIDFQPPDGPIPQHALPGLVVPASFAPDAPLIHSPPTLTLGSGPVEVDTVAFDEFSASSGSFSAASFGSGATPIFGIAGGAVGPSTFAGASYDVEKAGSFGILYLNSATGAYAYVPNNDAINALKAPSTDSFTIMASDGFASASQTFTVEIAGTDDAAAISGETGGSVAAGAMTAAAIVAASMAPDVPTATGTLTDTDVDDPANTFTAVNSPHTSDKGCGSYTITADGHWTYALDPANAAVLALAACQNLTDTFTVTTIGGTPQVMTMTIRGADDPAVISGDTQGRVVEAGGVHNSAQGVPTACGLLTATDVDGPSNAFDPIRCPEPSDHGYGSFTMTADGHWTFALDNGNCAVQALNAGQALTDDFTVRAADGTAQTVTVTIEGSNDAAVVCGDTCGRVTEPSNSCDPPPRASGTLSDRDVDNPDDTFTATTCPQASDNGYGSFTMTTCGTWTYVLALDNPAVQALRPCDALTDTFTVTTIDGTPQVVTVVIQSVGDQGLREQAESAFHFEAGAEQQHASLTAPVVVSSAPVAALDPEDDSAATAWPHPADAAADAWRFGEQEVAGQGLHLRFQQDLIV